MILDIIKRSKDLLRSLKSNIKNRCYINVYKRSFKRFINGIVFDYKFNKKYKR